MALAFTGGGTQKVDHGTPSKLASLNIQAGSILAWVKPSTITPGANREVYHRGLTTQRHLLQINSSNQLEFELFRGTTTILIRVALSSVPDTAAGAWCFWAITWDAASTDANQQIYGGSLTARVLETSTYATQRVGSGTVGDNSGANAFVGNHPSNSLSFVGDIAWVGIWNRKLTLAEIGDQQFNVHSTSGNVFYVHYGFNGTGTQVDLSPSTAGGTVTGATVSAHVPLGPTFAQRAQRREISIHNYAVSLAGSLPNQTGAISRKYQALRSLAGSLPNQTGVLTTLYQALRSLTGDLPNQTGTLTRIYQTTRSLAGDLPNQTGTLARLYQALRSLTGDLPNQTGDLTRSKQNFINLAGNFPYATGTLAAIVSKFISLAGDLPTPTGTLTRLYQASRSLAGDLPNQTGSLSRVYQALRSLAGDLPNQSGTLTTIISKFRTLTGDLPNPTGALTYIVLRVRTLAGDLPNPSGTLTRIYQASRNIAGDLPNPTGNLTRLTNYFRTLLGDLPTSTGVLTVLAGIIGINGAKAIFLSTQRKAANFLVSARKIARWL